MAIEIEINQADVDCAVQRMHGIPNALEQALYPAMAEITRDAHANIREAFKSSVPLSDKIINKAIRILPLRQQGGGFVGSISIHSKSVPLIEYETQPAGVTARKGMSSKDWPGFTYALRTGERRESTERLEGLGLPFIAETKTGHVGVFYRTGYRTRDSASGKPTWAIKQAYGPSVQYHFTPEMEQDVVDIASAALPRVFARFVDQVIAEHAVKGGTI